MKTLEKLLSPRERTIGACCCGGVSGFIFGYFLGGLAGGIVLSSITAYCLTEVALKTHYKADYTVAGMFYSKVKTLVSRLF